MSSRSGLTHSRPEWSRDSARSRRPCPGRPRIAVSAPKPSVPIPSATTLPPFPGNQTNEVPWYGPGGWVALVDDEPRVRRDVGLLLKIRAELVRAPVVPVDPIVEDLLEQLLDGFGLTHQLPSRPGLHPGHELRECVRHRRDGIPLVVTWVRP